MPSPKHTESISRKLTWMNMLVSGTALLVACSAFIGYDWVTFRANSVRNLTIQARIIAVSSTAAVLFDDPDSASKVLSVLKGSPDVVAAAVSTKNGGVLASYRRNSEVSMPGLEQETDASEHRKFQGRRVAVVVPIFVEAKLVGHVYLESDLQAIYLRLGRYIAISTSVLAVSLMAALLLSSLSRRSVSRPITALATTVRTVARDKDYSVRVDPPAKVNELGTLVEAFNELLTEIEHRDVALQEGQDLLEKRVEERTAQLAATNKELEAFSYSVSHDLRAPLRSIDGFSQAILEDYSEKLDPAAKEYLNRVRAAAARMGLLIDDLLKLARLTRIEVRKENIDLSTMASSIAENLHEQDPSRKVNFAIDQGLTTKGDPRLLNVALENLLGNAWKYTSHHDHALIEFGLSHKNGRSVFYVKDDGAGFNPEYSNRLFGAFQRLHGNNEFSGTGIGLATVQRIINKHGGEIWAESEVEKGATFYFSI